MRLANMRGKQQTSTFLCIDILEMIVAKVPCFFNTKPSMQYYTHTKPIMHIRTHPQKCRLVSQCTARRFTTNAWEHKLEWLEQLILVWRYLCSRDILHQPHTWTTTASIVHTWTPGHDCIYKNGTTTAKLEIHTMAECPQEGLQLHLHDAAVSLCLLPNEEQHNLTKDQSHWTEKHSYRQAALTRQAENYQN